MRSIFITPVLIVSFMSSAHAFGGIVSTKAGPGVFGKNGYSVIIAHVRDIAGVKGFSGEYSATLEPLVTVAGDFDPTAKAAVPVRLFARSVGSSFQEPPPAGSTIMAVVSLAPIHGDVNNLIITIEPSYCDFMPKEAGMVVIEGLGDKRVMETIEKIRPAMKPERK